MTKKNCKGGSRPKGAAKLEEGYRGTEKKGVKGKEGAAWVVVNQNNHYILTKKK